MTRVPVVAALAGRPPPPRQIHRSLRARRHRAGHRVRLVLALGCVARNGGGVIWLDPGVGRTDRRDHPRLALLPGPAGPGWPKVAHRHPPAPAGHGALPGSVGLGPLGHQPGHHDRGDHLRRRRRPLYQRLRLRRAEHGLEHAASCTARRASGSATGPNGTPHDTAQPLGAAGRRPRHRLRRRCARACRRTRQPGGSVGLQNPSGSGTAVERPHLRGHARPAAGLRHQPLVHPVQRRHPQLAARAGRLGRAADLRRGGAKGGGQLVGPGSDGGPGGGGPGPGNTNTCSPSACSPTRSSRKRASCPPAPRHRTR